MSRWPTSAQTPYRVAIAIRHNSLKGGRAPRLHEEFPELEVSCDDVLDGVYGPEEERGPRTAENRGYQRLVVECCDGGAEEEDAVEDERNPRVR